MGIRRGQLNRIINVQGIEGRGAAFINNQEQTNTQLTNTLNYNKQLSPKFNLNAVAGHEWLTYDTKVKWNECPGFCKCWVRLL